MEESVEPLAIHCIQKKSLEQTISLGNFSQEHKA